MLLYSIEMWRYSRPCNVYGSSLYLFYYYEGYNGSFCIENDVMLSLHEISYRDRGTVRCTVGMDTYSPFHFICVSCSEVVNKSTMHSIQHAGIETKPSDLPGRQCVSHRDWRRNWFFCFSHGVQNKMNHAFQAPSTGKADLEGKKKRSAGGTEPWTTTKKRVHC